MGAPSEKHLEDWIVENYQRVGYTDDYGDGDVFVPVIRKVIARQLRLPSGIADLVVLSGDSIDPTLSVVEIKRGVIDTKTLAQCLRYMRDLQEIFYWARFEWGFKERDYPARGIFEALHGYPPEIGGILIGDGMPDNNLSIACSSTQISPLVYSYAQNTDEYTFDLPDGDGAVIDGVERTRIYQDYVCGAVGDALRTVMQSRLDNHLRHSRANK